MDTSISLRIPLDVLRSLDSRIFTIGSNPITGEITTRLLASEKGNPMLLALASYIEDDNISPEQNVNAKRAFTMLSQDVKIKQGQASPLYYFLEERWDTVQLSRSLYLNATHSISRDMPFGYPPIINSYKYPW